ncbi:MAG: ferrous iron transport protein B [Flavobacteriaceae bacterium]|nr:ferrous iron transport protein B [Flavobacteriaceae bacterium]
MSNAKIIKIALVGNPNTGKTSLFNQLTGLKQNVGNYPGITVDRKEGFFKLNATTSASIIDLPGTYSINPTTLDENIVLETLFHPAKNEAPDVVVMVADVENLKRNLLLFSQLKDLEIPIILAINMADQMKRKGISIDIEALKTDLDTEVLLISARKNQGIDTLKKHILNYKKISTQALDGLSIKIDKEFFGALKETFPNKSLYQAWLTITQFHNLKNLSIIEKEAAQEFLNCHNKVKHLQHKETILRYQKINNILKKDYKVDRLKGSDLRAKLDKVLMHRVFGYVIFFLVLFLIFESIFDWAIGPMNFIDNLFLQLSNWTEMQLPPGVLTNLIVHGIIPGLGGIAIFIPQIAILFLFIAVLEETGYMSRVVFLMDKIMRLFGLNGKSVVPLMSGTACAIPAIMAARNISSWKERLITILVTPFITCSARLPIYAIIISLIIPNERLFGILSLQATVLMLLYLIGFLTAIISAFILDKTLKIKKRAFFIVEMPNYKLPSPKNVAYTVIEKTKAFIFGAGKIILALSIVLWFLASNGPSKFKDAEQIVTQDNPELNTTSPDFNQKVGSYKLEHSYIGYMGKAIEPIIKPLGYDWKIGIALISSFAAREVFVGTLATIYSVENEGDTETIRERMKKEINQDTGKPLFDFPTGMSLLLYYVFAMQCMSTLAVVKRETNSWKWPILQLFFMTGIAYLVSFTIYTFLS